jgi:hypothetical protein
MLQVTARVSCKRWLANGGLEGLIEGLLMGLGWLAQRLLHLAKPRLTVRLASAPLIGVGTLIAVGAFRLGHNP